MEEYLTIFCDLDGPILDNKPRFYTLYKDILKGLGCEKSILPLDTYWSLKRDKVNEPNILEIGGLRNEETIKLYIDRRFALIETKPYLQLNRIVSGAKETLGMLREKGRLFLVTTRGSRKNLMWELKEKGLLSYFDQILSSPAGQTAWDTKIGLISQVQYKCETTFIIGDTEAEIIAGKNLKIITVAVLNGIRSERYIKKLAPDYIVKNINSFFSLIHKG